MVKELKFVEDVCVVMLCGVDKLVDIVKVILGFKGWNVVLEKFYGFLLIINDGVMIVKEIELEDYFENMGVKFVLEVVLKINDIVGDGIMIVIVLI